MIASVATRPTFTPETALGASTRNDEPFSQASPLPRLTPETVLSAYLATGLLPAYGIFEDVERRAGCGLTVVCVARGLPWPGPWPTIISRWLGLDIEYVFGFIWGWDQVESRPESVLRRQGYADGVRCRLAVEREYGAVEAVS